MRRLICAVAFFVFATLAVCRAEVAVIDRISGEVVAVGADEKDFYVYDLGRYEMVEGETAGLSAADLKYDGKTVRAMNAAEKALKAREKENAWRSDFDALYLKIKNGLAADGLLAGAKKES